MGKIEEMTHLHHKADVLDGFPLKDGESLHITWPDGVTELIQVHIAHRKCHHNTAAEAYFISGYHKRHTWARLLGLTATRV